VHSPIVPTMVVTNGTVGSLSLLPFPRSPTGAMANVANGYYTFHDLINNQKPPDRKSPEHWHCFDFMLLPRLHPACP
jgi:hypothetical protein